MGPESFRDRLERIRRIVLVPRLSSWTTRPFLGLSAEQR